MPYRKRCFPFLSFLIGGFSLGALSLGDEYSANRDSGEAPVGIVGFRHSVYLREGRAAQPRTPGVRHGMGRYGAHLPKRRLIQPGAPAPSRDVERYGVRVPEHRIFPPGTPPPSRDAGRYALRLPEQRRFQPATPAPSRDAERYIVRLPEQRTFQAPSPYVTGGGQLWLQPTSFTPYDRYMGTVRAVINHLEPHPANMFLACQLMEEGRHFEYVSSDPYTANPPAVTAMVHAGDCKAKALWLYNGLGDANALFVIGKTTKYSRTSHAWVYWRNENRWWILDCTNRTQPIAADTVSEERYIPYYSYGRGGAFRHKATRLLINPLSPNSGTPAVADH